ncbi:MAG TPA: recombination protein RecR [Gammaproteobacteria bacterium]|jgi:recombination protein RecR|nr:recombination protein RecR [Gammaproteobacteria bacterium]
MSGSKAIDELREALKCLPGVGPRTAQRMSFYLMERDREGAAEIAARLLDALEKVRFCDRCNTFCESDLCDICSSAKRDKTLMCVVETPADLEAMEQSGVYEGLYFVLMGQLSPLDGVGPDKLGIDKLVKLLDVDEFEEIVIATNLTAEGEVTAEYLQDLIRPYGIVISRLARGVPIGGELEYMDQRTVGQAMRDRRRVSV